VTNWFDGASYDPLASRYIERLQRVTKLQQIVSGERFSERNAFKPKLIIEHKRFVLHELERRPLFSLEAISNLSEGFVHKSRVPDACTCRLDLVRYKFPGFSNDAVKTHGEAGYAERLAHIVLFEGKLTLPRVEQLEHRGGRIFGNGNRIGGVPKRVFSVLIRLHGDPHYTTRLLCYGIAMLICVGGIPGSGRKDFARQLAARLGFYTFDLESNMRTGLMRHAHYRAGNTETLSDEIRARMVRQAVRNFEHLSETFRNVMLDEPLHRAQTRALLFEAGAKYFSSVQMVWVEETEATQAERVLRIQEKNPRLSDETARSIIETMERDFEPFETPPILAQNVVGNQRALEETVRALGFT
jgi:predicted kinase